MTYAISREVLAEKPHIFPYVIDGEPVFVKKRRSGKNPVGKFFQRLLYRLTGNVLILPPEQPIGGTARHEAAVLRELAKRGINVPRVLHGEDGYFVMTDVGETLETVLRDNPEEKEYYIAAAARELRRLHDTGLAHGGSQIKNLAVKDGTIHFIDFEERIPEDKIPMFQMRDLFLFILSLERAGFDPDLVDICRAYGGERGHETAENLRRPLRGLRPVRLVENRLFSGMKLRDIRAVAALVDKTERIANAL